MNYTTLGKDERPIFSIVLENVWHQTGKDAVTSITIVEQTGEMAYIAWFEVWHSDLLYCRVNSSYVNEVYYQEGQPNDDTRL